MTPPPSHGRRYAGFTLLELLVALAVVGLLVVGLNQGVRTGLDLRRDQARRINTTAELDSAARTLRNLLTNLPITPAAALDPVAPPAPLALYGTADRLDFIGDLPTGLGAVRRADITLGVHGDRLVLSWRPHKHERGGRAEKPIETELLRGVTRLEFAYWDSAPPGGEAGWLTQWDGSIVPALIRVRLNFAEGNARHWPDLIVAPRLWAPFP